MELHAELWEGCKTCWLVFIVRLASFVTLPSHLKCGSHGFQQRKHTDKTLEWALPAQESHPVASCAWYLSWIPRLSSHWVLHTDHHFRSWYLPTVESSCIHVSVRISVWSKHSWTLTKRCKRSLCIQFTILTVSQVNKNATEVCLRLHDSGSDSNFTKRFWYHYNSFSTFEGTNDWFASLLDFLKELAHKNCSWITIMIRCRFIQVSYGPRSGLAEWRSNMADVQQHWDFSTSYIVTSEITHLPI